MKNFVFLAALPLLSFCLGCGPKAMDTSGSDAPPTTESTQEELESAVESGEIDPATYGKE
jgi:hypothetical protein